MLPNGRTDWFGENNIHPNAQMGKVRVVWRSMQAQQATAFPASTHRIVRASDPSEIQPSESRMGRLDVLKRLLHAASFAHPGTKKQLWWRTAAHFARCAFHLGAFRVWFGDSTNPALRETLAQRPSLIMCTIHPYLNTDWRFEQKLEKISEHYRLLSGRLSILRFAPPAFIA